MVITPTKESRTAKQIRVNREVWSLFKSQASAEGKFLEEHLHEVLCRAIDRLDLVKAAAAN